MKSFSLLLGARNTPKRGKRFAPSDDRIIREVTTRHFPDGFTILKSSGGWFDPKKRKFIHEESRQIIVCRNARSQLRSWCSDLARALGQKELLMVELGPAVMFRVKRAPHVALHAEKK